MYCTNCGKEISEDNCQQRITEDCQCQDVCRDQYDCYPRLIKNPHSRHMPTVYKNATRYVARGVG